MYQVAPTEKGQHKMTLAIQQAAQARTIDTINDKYRWCEAMADGDMLPRQYRGKPANLLFAVEYADALGIPRINALTSIHVIEGKPSASADLLASIVRKAGHKLRVRVTGQGQQATATATLIRADDPDFEYSCTWNWARALDAKVARKDNWQNYPEAMMKARAITEVIREGATDAMYGVIYTPEELGAIVDQSGNAVHATVANGQRQHATATRTTPPQHQAQQPATLAPQTQEQQHSGTETQNGIPTLEQISDLMDNPQATREQLQQAWHYLKHYEDNHNDAETRGIAKEMRLALEQSQSSGATQENAPLVDAEPEPEQGQPDPSQITIDMEN